MSTDEYMPSEAEMIAGLVQLPDEPAGLCRRVRPDEMKRGLARVRRDAARSALDGYADALNRNRSAAVWAWPEFVTDVREWAAYNYPEETPDAD